MNRFLWGFVALGLFLGVTGQARPAYTFTTIDVPGAVTTNALGINATGQIVGTSIDAANTSHGFLLSGGNYITFDVPGASQTAASGINASAQIVGTYVDARGQHGYLLSGGSYTTLDVPGAGATIATCINDAGLIVGWYVDSGGTKHAFLLSGGSYTTFDVPGATMGTQAYGINASAQIVGQYVDAGGTTHGFMLSGGIPTTLDSPGSVGTAAFGINNSGQIVGVYVQVAGQGNHGFLLSGGSYTTVDVPGASQTDALAINASGQIVGNFNDASGKTHGFLAAATTVSGFAWHGPTMTITTGAAGIPSLVQAVPGTYGTKGNYELVVPLQSGGLAHFYRDNDDPTLPWNGPFTFATDQGIVDAVCLIQSNFSTQFVNTGVQGPGNLAVVARIGNALVYYYRDDVAFNWYGPVPIFTGVSGNPSFVQARPGTFGTKGNYELVVPLQSGGLGHFYRDNDDPTLPWNGPFIFATDQGFVDAVSLIQSNFSTQFVNTGVQGPGNLAVVARIGNNLVYFYRDDVDPFAWHGPTVTITTGVTGNPSFVQATPGTYGTKGNYELVVPLQSGGLAHFYRNNDDPNLPWNGPFTFATDQGFVSAVSLIQSNFSTQFVNTGAQGPGNLAVASVINNALGYFYRDDQ